MYTELDGSEYDISAENGLQNCGGQCISRASVWTNFFLETMQNVIDTMHECMNVLFIQITQKRKSEKAALLCGHKKNMDNDESNDFLLNVERKSATYSYLHVRQPSEKTSRTTEERLNAIAM